jgi:MFS family permease
MEIFFEIPLLIIPLLMPFFAGQMAKQFGRKFWPWFFIGIVLPMIANIILLILPDKSKNFTALKPVENEDIFDHLFINADLKKIKNHETFFSSRA